MSRKCFETITLYAFFLIVMVGTALIFSYLQFDHVIGKIVLLIILMLVATTLALTVEKGSVTTIVFNAILWDTALSFLFDHLGSPNLLHIVYVALVMIDWFLLFCFLTNFSFTKKNHAGLMILWGMLLVAADIVFALNMMNVLGWTAIILLVPFITFFVSLPGEAEGFTEHTHHIAIYSTLPALFLVMFLLSFRGSHHSFEKRDFFPEVNDDYVFVYCPKGNDDESETEDLSEFM